MHRDGQQGIAAIVGPASACVGAAREKHLDKEETMRKRPMGLCRSARSAAALAHVGLAKHEERGAPPANSKADRATVPSSLAILIAARRSGEKRLLRAHNRSVGAESGLMSTPSFRLNVTPAAMGPVAALPDQEQHQ